MKRIKDAVYINESHDTEVEHPNETQYIINAPHPLPDRDRVRLPEGKTLKLIPLGRQGTGLRGRNYILHWEET